MLALGDTVAPPHEEASATSELLPSPLRRAVILSMWFCTTACGKEGVYNGCLFTPSAASLGTGIIIVTTPSVQSACWTKRSAPSWLSGPSPPRRPLPGCLGHTSQCDTHTYSAHNTSQRTAHAAARKPFTAVAHLYGCGKRMFSRALGSIPQNASAGGGASAAAHKGGTDLGSFSCQRSIQRRRIDWRRHPGWNAVRDTPWVIGQAREGGHAWMPFGRLTVVVAPSPLEAEQQRCNCA